MSKMIKPSQLKLSKRELKLAAYAEYREGTKIPILAKKYGVRKSTMYNWINSIQVTNTKKLEKMEEMTVKKDLDLINYAYALMNQLEQPFLECKTSGDFTPMSKIAGVMVKLIDTLAKLTGQIASPQTNVQVNVGIMNDIRKLLNLEKCPHCGEKLED